MAIIGNAGFNLRGKNALVHTQRCNTATLVKHDTGLNKTRLANPAGFIQMQSGHILAIIRIQQHSGSIDTFEPGIHVTLRFRFPESREI